MGGKKQVSQKLCTYVTLHACPVWLCMYVFFFKVKAEPCVSENGTRETIKGCRHSLHVNPLASTVRTGWLLFCMCVQRRESRRLRLMKDVRDVPIYCNNTRDQAKKTWALPSLIPCEWLLLVSNVSKSSTEEHPIHWKPAACFSIVLCRLLPYMLIINAL